METVAVVISEKINPFFVAVPRMIFSELPPAGHKREIRLCAVEPGKIEMEGGLSAKVESGLEALKQASMIVIPYWPDPNKKPSDALLTALRAAHKAGTPIVALCRGSFVLGYSGLLDGKRAATHWYDSEIFHSQFPSVQLDKDVLYVEDDGLTTSAGIAAGIDCCLHVLRILEGAKVANSVARLMVSPPFREGGQRQFIEQPVPMHSIDQRISKAIKELSESLNKTVDFRSVAHAAAMSERSFYRVFVKTTGMTPYRWLLCARLRRAQELLEGSDFSVESVAIHCGFESVITFRKRFKEQFGISPSAWRKTFCSDS